MCNLYKGNYDNIVKLNQQWSEIFSAPFLGKVSQVQKEVQVEREKLKVEVEEKAREQEQVKTSRERVKIEEKNKQYKIQIF